MAETPITISQQNSPQNTQPAAIPLPQQNLTPIAPQVEDSAAPAPVVAPQQAQVAPEVTPQQFQGMAPKKTLTPAQFKKLVPKHANLESMMKVAPQAKQHIDALADKIAGKIHSKHPVIQAPIKGEDRTRQKIESDYGGDHNKLTDLVRNTVILKNKEHVKDFLKEAKEHGAVATKYMKGDEDNYMGYSGGQAKFMTPHGIHAEIQANTPAMIVAKENPEVAEKMLGEEHFKKIAELFKKADVPLGEGHKLYEQHRVLKPTPANREKLKELHEKSKKYYDQVRSIVEA